MRSFTLFVFVSIGFALIFYNVLAVLLTVVVMVLYGASVIQIVTGAAMAIASATLFVYIRVMQKWNEIIWDLRKIFDE